MRWPGRDRRDASRDPGHDVELRGLMHDAVDDVEPAYRLEAIRARTSPGGTPRTTPAPRTTASATALRRWANGRTRRSKARVNSVA